MSSTVVQEIASKEQFKQIVEKPTLSVIHFMTPWAPIVKSTEEVIADLSSSPELKDVVFAALDAEGFNGEISLQHNVSCVPTVLFFKQNRVIDRIDGVHPGEIAKKVMQHAQANQPPAAPVSTPNSKSPRRERKISERVEERLRDLVNRHKIMIFMKGNPGTPKCGFSRTLISIIKDTGVNYGTFDILEDEEVRQALKIFSNWHTYPQLYVNGNLVGGLDIIKDIKESGDLMATLRGDL